MSGNRRRGGRRERGGSGARRALRSRRFDTTPLPYIQRNVPVFDVLSQEGLEIIENNAEVIMEEVGIAIKDDPDTIAMWRDAGADVADDGETLHFPRGLARSLLATAPSSFTQRARNPQRSVKIGDGATVFAPVYGPPFIHNLDDGRRYATIEDFRNFVKLAYMTPAMHHSGERSASRSTSPSTSATSTWCMPTSRIPTSPSWGRSPHPNARQTPLNWRESL